MLIPLRLDKRPNIENCLICKCYFGQTAFVTEHQIKTKQKIDANNLLSLVNTRWKLGRSKNIRQVFKSRSNKHINFDRARQAWQVTNNDHKTLRRHPRSYSSQQDGISGQARGSQQTSCEPQLLPSSHVGPTSWCPHQKRTICPSSTLLKSWLSLS